MKKRKDGRYQTSVYIGVVNGKKKNVLICGKTQKECKEKAAALKQKINKGIDYTTERDTWADWVQFWKEMKKHTKSERQLNDDTYYLKHFETLDNIQLNKLQIADFQRIINKLYKNNPTTHKPTAKKSLIKFKSAAFQVFEFAVENRATDFNPVKYVKIPKDAPQKERRSLTAEEQKWIEEFPHRAQLPAMIMLYSGLRLAECLALQWKDIDFNKKTIDVNKTLIMNSKPPKTKPNAKTEAGIRVVDIPQKLVNFLSPLKKNPFDYVCTNTRGALYNKSSWRKLWESYQKDLNYNYGDFSLYVNKPKNKYQPNKIPMVIDGFTAHYLRHTHATNLFDAGCNIMYVKEQLGHTDIKTTLGIYTHLSKRNKDKNSKKLDALLDNVV